MQMIKEIMDFDGVPTVTAAIHAAIAGYYKKIKPNYMNQGSPMSHLSMQDKVKAKIEQKEMVVKIKADKKFNEKSQICVNVLGGEVFKDNSGGFSCRFATHFADSPDEEQILPLDIVNVGYATNQFFPSKEAVFKKKPALKKKFDNLSLK